MCNVIVTFQLIDVNKDDEIHECNWNPGETPLKGGTGRLRISGARMDFPAINAWVRMWTSG